jgi:hypothetical protein
MLELLVSGGVTGRVGADKRGPILLEPADFSGLYLAYQPGLVGDPEEAASATERLIQELQETDSRVPGEASRLQRERCIREDVVTVEPEAFELIARFLAE